MIICLKPVAQHSLHLDFELQLVSVVLVSSVPISEPSNTRCSATIPIKVAKVTAMDVPTAALCILSVCLNKDMKRERRLR